MCILYALACQSSRRANLRVPRGSGKDDDCKPSVFPVRTHTKDEGARTHGLGGKDMHEEGHTQLKISEGLAWNLLSRDGVSSGVFARGKAA